MTVLGLPDGPLRVVALGAHPDDIEIGCGGTLLALAEREDVEVHSLVLTGGADRQAEARSAAAAFGVSASPVLLGLPDSRLPEHWGAVKDALHDLRAAVTDPHVIFAPRVDDAHQDHRLLGTLVPTVWRGPLILHYEIPKWDGDMGMPNAYVPLRSELVERKVRLLFEHFPSQHSRAWWDEEYFRSVLRLRGVEAQSRYAEAFHVGKLLLSAGAR
jgi:LmbE family N-acetylglucosaminyl deacetylase